MDDHDLLIELKTMVGVLIDGQKEQLMLVRGLDSRVNALEAKDRGDSERIGSVLEAVKASTNNSSRISEAHLRVDNLRDEVSAKEGALNKRMDGIADELRSFRSKSNIMDAVNAAGAMIAGVIGSIFGGR